MAIQSTPDMYGKIITRGSNVKFTLDKVLYHGVIKIFIFNDGRLLTWVEKIHPKLGSRWMEPNRLAWSPDK